MINVRFLARVRASLPVRFGCVAPLLAAGAALGLMAGHVQAQSTVGVRVHAPEFGIRTGQPPVRPGVPVVLAPAPITYPPVIYAPAGDPRIAYPPVVDPRVIHPRVFYPGVAYPPIGYGPAPYPVAYPQVVYPPVIYRPAPVVLVAPWGGRGHGHGRGRKGYVPL
jgi:hypothetical protein